MYNTKCIMKNKKINLENLGQAAIVLGFYILALYLAFKYMY
jgi:hypothetical protein